MFKIILLLVVAAHQNAPLSPEDKALVEAVQTKPDFDCDVNIVEWPQDKMGCLIKL